MANDTSEIVKLTERISKDPKSKLFVPLAEEYKKAGDLEMSIHVLTEGLKHNPGYVTAKSFLGRLLLEKGDLPGAQKEFEEVVKAIPDNLLAQRKLGDIYALQGNAAKALTHYKVALSLNPKDEETAGLVSDLEAGRPVTAERLHRPKPQTVPEPAAKQKPLPPAQPAGTPAAPRAAAPQTPAPARNEPETPEEVLVVEPLEPAAPAGSGTVAGGFDFLAETGPQPIQYGEEQTGGFPGAGEPYQPSGVGTAGMPDIQASARFRGENVGSEKPSREAFPAAGTTEQVSPQSAESKTDDFTTNTLAELYISQGFYEKAIDIYERMLADNPESRAVQAKLDQVRAMAGQTVPSRGLSGEPEQVEQTPWIEQPGIAPPAESAFGDFSAPAGDEFKQAAPFDVGGGGFEPLEYHPGSEGPRQAALDEEPAAVARVSPRKKQTIYRLEQWLKNIVKEK